MTNEIQNKYNWSVSHSEIIHADVQKVWEIISMKSNLELFHPFCNKNPVIEWSKENSIDEIEYLNGMVLRRNFSYWEDNRGYDLYINEKGKPSSYVSWRLLDQNDSSQLSIKIFPYLYNHGGKIKNILPFYIFVNPLLNTYLKSVIKGLKFYVERGERVAKNQFGRHSWFS